MKITRELQVDLYAHNAGILNARADYYAQPTEFNQRIYCRACSLKVGSGRNCETYIKTRDQRRRRAEVAA